jgi:hypothetical protein
MINDALDFGFAVADASGNVTGNFSGYKINFGVYFQVTGDRRFNKADVKLEVIDCIKDFFLVDKMNFSQPINLNELKYEILSKDGVVAIPTLKIFQSTTTINDFTGTARILANLNADGTVVNGGTEGYGFAYDFQSALNVESDIIRPSLTPSVFELRNPNTDIYGRVI